VAQPTKEKTMTTGREFIRDAAGMMAGGGYLPSYAPRSDHSCFVSPPGCDHKIVPKKKPTEYLNIKM
jgi:hypothetical protein